MEKTITVSTQKELIAALGQATGGETILLASGDYGDLQLAARTKINLTYSSEVTIAAANPQAPPVFTGLDLRGVTNLSFEGVTFDYTFAEGHPLYLRPFKATGCTNIEFNNCTFDGDIARGTGTSSDGYATGFGLGIGGSTGVTVEGCEFFNFYRGLVIGGSNDVSVVGNDLHDLRMDGMNFSSVQRVLIEDNYIHDFARSPDPGDHADMIQFWTNGTTRPSTDIMIRGNTLDIGEGNATQSIFMRNDLVDRGLAGEEMFYQRVTIEDNVIVNGHTNGIIVGETSGLVVRNNSVLHSDGGKPDGADASVEIPRISVALASTSVTITQNAASSISGYAGQADWTVTKNAIVQDQDPFALGYYGDIFVASSLQAVDGVHRFVAVPGGLLDTLDAGATATLTPPVSATLDAAFHVTAPVSGDQIRHFDAGLTTGLQPAGTTYLWSFGDGTTASGKTVTHDYGVGGTYDVTLTVKLPTGKTNSETLTLKVDGDELLRLDDSGAFAVYSHGHETLLARPTAGSADGLQLGATGVAASVGRSHLATMLATDDVTIAMTIDADKVGTVGEIARLQGSFILGVTTRGELQVRAWSSEGDAVNLISTGVKVNTGSDHEIELRLDSGRLGLWIDGKMAADAAFEGRLASSGTSALTFGNPWGKANFFGDLHEFEIVVNDGPGSQTFSDDPFTTAHTMDLSGPVM